MTWQYRKSCADCFRIKCTANCNCDCHYDPRH